MRKLFSISLLCVSFLLAQSEQVIRLTPSDDVYTYSNSEIRGMEPVLRTYHSTAGPQYRRITFLKFDISQVPTEVDSVVLRLYTSGWSAGGDQYHKFDLYPVAINTWAEDDLTFSNYKEKAGADMTTVFASYQVDAGLSQAADWFEWKSNSLTSYVQDSAAAAKQYISFRLREAKVVKKNGNAVVVDFHSKENESGFAPELIVYAPDGAQPAKRDTIPVVHDSTEARLSAILLDGEKLEFFDKDQFSYNVNLPYSTTQNPTITAMLLDTTATAVVKDNSITTTSADGKHNQTYIVTFTVLPKMDLFLAIGQSNMSGRAPYADATEDMEGVYLLTPANGMEISSNPMNKYSTIRKDLSVQGMGPHYQFALSMRDSLPGHTIGMVVNAQGGSSITSWYQPGKSNYDASIKRAIEAKKWGTFRGVIWHQGGSDKSSAASDNYVSYKNRLNALANNLRQDLGIDTLWFIVGELGRKTENLPFNENAIQTVTSYIPYSDYVSSEDCSLLSDNTHFDEAGAKRIGQRYAEKVLQHVYPNREQPTGLNGMIVQEKFSKKILKNGQFVIMKNDVSYTLLGIEQ